jgi:hypothetical protein
VLPDRIELSTSPLPMECSTTELRQHARDTRLGRNGPLQGGRSLPQGPRLRKRAAGLRGPQNATKSARKTGQRFWAAKRAGPVPHFARRRAQVAAGDRRLHECRAKHNMLANKEPNRLRSPQATRRRRLSVSPGHMSRFTMQDESDKDDRQTGGHAKNPRTDRLKLALRENLKRRKSQARARSDVATASSNRDDAPPHDGGGKKPG